MIKHIVMINFKEENKQENIKEAKKMLEDLLQSVPSLNSIEVGINFSTEDRSMDMSLYTEFNDRAGLELYAVHPEHLKVLDFIRSVATGSKVSDYEIV